MPQPAPAARPIRRIACVQLSGEFPDFCHRVVMPDYGMPLIGTILSEVGYDVSVFVEHVQAPDWQAVARADLVCLSTLSAGAEKTYRLADRVRAELGVPVVMGGTHASYFVDDCLEHCDYVVVGEGDATILELVDTLARGADPAGVAGIAYRERGGTRLTPARPGLERFETVPNFELIQGYRRMSGWDMLRRGRIPLLTVQSSRGCPFHCTYCIVDTMFPAGYRKRDVESVIRDLRDKRRYGRELLFVDNNFAVHREHTKALLRRMIEERLDFDIMVLTRADVARDAELLELMRAAGVSQQYQGYESVEPATLLGYDKRQTVERIRESIERLHSFGFRISGSFVLGADTDTQHTLDATVDFVLDSRLTIAYFFPLWGHYVEQKNGNSSIVPRPRAIFRGWRYCDGNFVTHFPRQMRPSQLQLGLVRAHRRVFSAAAIARALRERRYADAWEKATHRLMWSTIERGLLDYVPWLEQIEHELYDAQDHLLEERLLERYNADPSWKFTAAGAPAASASVAPVTLPVPRVSNIRCVPAES